MGQGRVNKVRTAIVVVSASLLIAAGLTLLLNARGDDFGWGFTVPAVFMLVIGAFLMVRQPANRIGLVLGAGGAAWLLYTSGGELARLSSTTDAPALSPEYIAAWVGSWVGALLPVSLAALIVLFPDGRLTGIRRWFTYFLLGLAAVAVIGGVMLWGQPHSVLTDFGLLDTEPAYVPVDIAFGLGFYACFPATLLLIARYRKGSAVERQQIKWVLAATGLFGFTFMIGVMLDWDGQMDLIWELGIGVALSAIPLSIAVAVFRYRLYEIDRILSRTVAYTLVVGLLGIVVFLLVTGLTLFLPSDDPLVVAVATLSVFALFNPLRRNIQTLVDRRFNRSRYDAARVIDDFTLDLRNRLDPDEVVDDWIGVVRTTMEPAHLAVWVKR
jgi:hypothetical protein